MTPGCAAQSPGIHSERALPTLSAWPLVGWKEKGDSVHSCSRCLWPLSISLEATDTSKGLPIHPLCRVMVSSNCSGITYLQNRYNHPGLQVGLLEEFSEGVRSLA